MEPIYTKQVMLLCRVLPFLNQFDDVALKGGTAINLFFREMPRLSVDIDLTYLPITNRVDALERIDHILNTLYKSIKTPLNILASKYSVAEDFGKNMVVTSSECTIKVEINPVVRGSVFPPEKRVICSSAQNKFNTFSEILCLNKSEVYAGKLCAALSRKHPRDSYDMLFFLEENEIDKEFVESFLIYLLSANRPVHEILAPRLDENIYLHKFQKEFQGMSYNKVGWELLVELQKKLPALLINKLENKHKEFLISFLSCSPSWHLVYEDNSHVSKLPAIQWRLLNLEKLKDSSARKFKSQIQALEGLF